MANINPDLPKNTELAKKLLDNTKELNRLKVERGYLGNLWGTSKNIPYNVAGLIIIILSLTGVVFTFTSTLIPANNAGLSIKEFWSIISPIITLALGYLFGSHSARKDESSES